MLDGGWPARKSSVALRLQCKLKICADHCSTGRLLDRALGWAPAEHCELSGCRPAAHDPDTHGQKLGERARSRQKLWCGSDAKESMRSMEAQLARHKRRSSKHRDSKQRRRERRRPKAGGAGGAVPPLGLARTERAARAAATGSQLVGRFAEKRDTLFD